MARTEQVIETITCDLCGRPAQEDSSVMLGWDGDEWRVDLCHADYRRVESQFDKWIANSEPATVTRTKSRTGTTRRRTDRRDDEWSYLESRGFKRHRGRKSAAEVEALAKRS
jgi:hypothetical protein